MNNEITFRNFTFITRRKKKIFAPLPLIRTNYTEINNEPKIGIISHAQDLWWDFNHCWTIFLKINITAKIDTFGIAGQNYWRGVKQISPNTKIRTFFEAKISFIAIKNCQHRHRRHEVKVCLTRTLKIERIKELLRCLFRWITAKHKFKIPDRCC